MNPQQPADNNQPQQHNPYDFILNNEPPAPKSKLSLPQGKSTLQRALIFGVGAVLVLVVGLILASIFGGNDRSTQLLTLAEEQTEIIRVADLAKNERTVRLATTKNLASNTSISMNTSLKQTVPLIKGVKIKENTLTGKKDSSVDQALTAAAANNEYDETFVKILTNKLTNYQNTVSNLFKSSKSAKEKQLLQKTYSDTSLILKSIK